MLLNIYKEAFKNKDFGYNENVIEDHDTKMFYYSILSALTITNDLPKDFYKYQKENGGWATYMPNSKFIDYLGLEDSNGMKGWLEAKDCVSSSTAFYLHEYFGVSDKRTIKFLEKKKFDSYWWTSNIYTYSCILKSKIIKNRTKETIAKRLKENIDSNGCWKNDFGHDSVFFTAMAYLSLFVYDPNYLPSKDWQKGIHYLINSQFDDGSFEQSRILKIPAPNVNNSNEVKAYKLGTLGTNIIIEDHNRLFTSSIVLNCLNTIKDVIR